MTESSPIESALNDPERELLEKFLDQYREELVRTLDGLTEELACHTGHGEILREQIDAGLIPPQASTA